METNLTKIWNKRNSIKPNTKNWKPFKGWSKTENRKHLVFLIKINNKKILNKIKKIQKDLSENKSYIEFPNNYYHITIKSWKFLNNIKTHPDDLSSKEIKETINKIKLKLSNSKGFEIKIKNINLFPGVIFLECQNNNLSQLNKKLTTIQKIDRSWRDYPNFIPHCAIGTFKSKNIKKLIKKLEKYRKFDFGYISVNGFELVIAHWYKTKYPRFETIKKFSLNKATTPKHL